MAAEMLFRWFCGMCDVGRRLTPRRGADPPAMAVDSPRRYHVATRTRLQRKKGIAPTDKGADCWDSLMLP